jgi:hypothetical protein
MTQPLKESHDTPETDAAIFWVGPCLLCSLDAAAVIEVDYCRRIEREREYYKQQLGLYRGNINNEGIETASSALDHPPMFTGQYLAEKAKPTDKPR